MVPSCRSCGQPRRWAHGSQSTGQRRRCFATAPPLPHVGYGRTHGPCLRAGHSRCKPGRSCRLLYCRLDAHRMMAYGTVVQAVQPVTDDVHGLGRLAADRAVGGNAIGNEADHLTLPFNAFSTASRTLEAEASWSSCRISEEYKIFETAWPKALRIASFNSLSTASRITLSKSNSASAFFRASSTCS